MARETYHGWEVTQTRGKNGRLTVTFTNPHKAGDVVLGRTAENDKTLDYQTLLSRGKVDVCLLEVGRSTGETRKAWLDRLAGAVLADNEERVARRARQMTTQNAQDIVVRLLASRGLSAYGGKVRD